MSLPPCITICQPFASLVMLPAYDSRHKRVENRRRRWDYRGPVLIHAGKSRDWLFDDGTGWDARGFRIAELPFGAILGSARLVDCFEVLDGPSPRFRVPRPMALAHPWLLEHMHVEGPFCLVLADVRPFPEPIPCPGQLGLWRLQVTRHGDVPRRVWENLKADAAGVAR